MPSHRSPTIIVLYDHDCRASCAELFALKAQDQRHQIKLINIRDAKFSAHAWGFAPRTLFSTLHVRDLAGHWHIALDAIHLIYQSVGVIPPIKRAALPGLRVDFDTISPRDARSSRLDEALVQLGATGSLSRDSLNRDSLSGGSSNWVCSNDDAFVAGVNDKNSRA